MPNFEDQKNPREDFNKNEENAENLNAQLAEAMNSKNYAEVGAIAKKLEETAGNKNELIGNAQEEAGKEDEQRDLGAEMAKDTENEIAAKELEDLKLKDETESAEKAEEILKKINGEGSETKDKELTPEDIAIERFKGTTSYDKDGRIQSIYPAMRNNAKFMLEAFKLRPVNIDNWASKQLMDDPDFLEQLKIAYKEKYPDKDADKYIDSITYDKSDKYRKHNIYDIVEPEDVPDNFIEDARKKAENYNKTSGWEQSGAK